MKQNILKLIIGVLLLSSTLLMAKTYTINQPSDNNNFKKSAKPKIKVLTKKNFKSVIHTKDKLVVVKFFATWCGPCKEMKPEFKQASRSLQKQVVYATVDVDDLGKITKSMEVNSIPTTILFKNGHEISRKLSGMNRLEILTWIHSFL